MPYNVATEVGYITYVNGRSAGSDAAEPGIVDDGGLMLPGAAMRWPVTLERGSKLDIRTNTGDMI